MTRTNVKKHPRKGTKGVKQHTRSKIDKKVSHKRVPKVLAMSKEHKDYLKYNGEGKYSETVKNPLFNNFDWTTRAHYDLLQQELNSGSFSQMFPEFLSADTKDVKDLTMRDIRSFENALNKSSSNNLRGFDPKDEYFNFSRDELIYGDAMKVLLTPKGRREWKKTEKYFQRNPDIFRERYEYYHGASPSDETIFDEEAGAWMFK